MGPFVMENIMHLKAKQDFSWAHRGVQIEEFKKGQLIETEDKDLIDVATKEGWAEKAKAPSKAEQKKALEELIAKLEGDLVDAEGDAEAAIEAELSKARADLAALG